MNYAVAVTAPGTGTPTGNVTVSDGAASCTGTVAAGTCTLASTTAGAKTLTATYAGDGNFATSSGTTSHQVNAAATATTITGDTPDPSTVNVAYTVSFAVTATAPGAGTPTGNVTVSDGAATCIATVAVGNCTLTSTTTGAKTLTATYAGDANFTASISAGATHTVLAAGSATAITGDTPDPSVTGQAIAVSFTVTGAAPTPTGNVTVSDGVATCTGALNASAIGTCNLIPATAGVKTLTATYAGDAFHGGSTSVGISHTVNAASTTTTITSDTPDPSIVNVAYAVTYAVAAVAPGAGTPTGNVTVSDGAASCTATVAAGTCSLTSTTSGAKDPDGDLHGGCQLRRQQRHYPSHGERRDHDHDDYRRDPGSERHGPGDRGDLHRDRSGSDPDRERYGDGWGGDLHRGPDGRGRQLQPHPHDGRRQDAHRDLRGRCQP